LTIDYAKKIESYILNVVIDLQCCSAWTKSVASEGSCPQKHTMGVWYVFVLFLLRSAMHKHGTSWRPVSVVTLVYCIQTVKDIVRIFLLPGSPITLVS